MAVKARAQITLTVQIDIQSVWWYYKLQSSTAAKPAKPTVNPPSGWTLTEPTYTEGSTNTLYFVELTVFTDGSFQYTDVSVDSSYEAAKAAWNKANAAQSSANSANDKIDNLQVGGRNYVKGTQGTWSEWITPGTGTNISSVFAEIDYADMNLVAGDTIAMQIEIEGKGFTQCTRFLAQGAVNNSWSGDAYFGNPWTYLFDLGSNLNKINSANRYTRVFAIPQYVVDKIKAYGGVADLGIRIDNANAEAKYRFRRIKVEKGSLATDWTVAPEDNTPPRPNLLKNSAFTNENLQYWTVKGAAPSIVTFNGQSCARFTGEMGKTYHIYQNTVSKLKPNTTYTFSAWVYTANIVKGTTNPLVALYQEGYYLNSEGSNKWFSYGSSVQLPANSQKWQRVSRTFVTDERINTATNYMFFVYARDFTGDVYFRHLKVEENWEATDWVAAPEDYADALETELKLADVSAQINVASDSIRQEVKAEYSAAAGNIAELDRRLETLSSQSETNFAWSVSQIDTLKSNLGSATEATEEQLRLIQTYMTFSQSGLTIGKTGNPFTFRVVNDRLAFYMNNTEVAYLSNNKLYVTQAEILESMKIGKFAFEPQANGNLSLIYTG